MDSWTESRVGKYRKIAEGIWSSIEAEITDINLISSLIALSSIWQFVCRDNSWIRAGLFFGVGEVPM